MEEKMESLLRGQPNAVHMGVCTELKDSSRCPTIQKVAERLKEQGAVLVNGTH